MGEGQDEQEGVGGGRASKEVLAFVWEGGGAVSQGAGGVLPHVGLLFCSDQSAATITDVL